MGSYNNSSLILELDLLNFVFTIHFVDICRTAGLTSFPDYLVLHMRKFVMEAGWVPKKLGIFLIFFLQLLKYFVFAFSFTDYLDF